MILDPGGTVGAVFQQRRQLAVAEMPDLHVRALPHFLQLVVVRDQKARFGVGRFAACKTTSLSSRGISVVLFICSCSLLLRSRTLVTVLTAAAASHFVYDPHSIVGSHYAIGPHQLCRLRTVITVPTPLSARTELSGLIGLWLAPIIRSSNTPRLTRCYRS